MRMLTTRAVVAVAVTTVVGAIGVLTAAPATAAPASTPTSVQAISPQAAYIFAFKVGTPREEVDAAMDLITSRGGTVTHVYTVIDAFAAFTDTETVALLQAAYGDDLVIELEIAA